MFSQSEVRRLEDNSAGELLPLQSLSEGSAAWSHYKFFFFSYWFFFFCPPPLVLHFMHSIHPDASVSLMQLTSPFKLLLMPCSDKAASIPLLEFCPSGSGSFCGLFSPWLLDPVWPAVLFLTTTRRPPTPDHTGGEQRRLFGLDSLWSSQMFLSFLWEWKLSS